MFQIDAMSRTPVYEQIVTQAEKLILRGILNVGDKMPSVRSLSMELSINPNTIQKAYTEMDRQGMVVSVPGKGVFIAENAKEILSKTRQNKIADLRILLQELLLGGVSEEEVIACVKEVFNAG